MNGSTKIIGKIGYYLYRNDNDGFSVCKVELEDKTVITASGYFPHLPKDLYYEFTGNYIVHKKYGYQFQIDSFQVFEKEDEESIINYLSSDLFYGIGQVTAKHIIDSIGLDCLSKILEDKSILNVTNLSAVKKERLYQDLLANKALEKTLIDLGKIGLSVKMIMKLYEKYQDKSTDVIYRNPYILIDELDHFSFKKCDELAMKMGYPLTSYERMSACIVFLLKEVTYKRGFTFLTHEQLFHTLKNYLNQIYLIEDRILFDSMEKIKMHDQIKFINNLYYLKVSFDAEKNVASKIIKLSDNTQNEYQEQLLDDGIKLIENMDGIYYTDSQKHAIKEAMINNFVVITGGPGTGKTTIIKAILRIYAFLNGLDIHEDKFLEDVLLIAPTGRAAKKITEATLIKASTIHRALGYNRDGEYSFNEENKLMQNFIIIDEASMIDIFLANHLFSSLKENVKIIIVGDVNQLPSVGPGQFLIELIESNMCKIIYLTEIMRQAIDSNIVLISNQIKEGYFNHQLINKNDLQFIESKTQNIIKDIKYVLTNLFEEGYSMDDIQILAPMYKGLAGIDAINEMISLDYNDNKEYIKHKDKVFKKYDRVIQTVNDPDKRIMNGDVGIIKDIIINRMADQDNSYLLIEFDQEIIRYQINDLDDLSLAYAISIHKSQGSEYKVVILPMVKSYSIMLKRKIIYTAITRAKNKIIILGDYQALMQGVNTIDDIRQTSLKQLMISPVNINHKNRIGDPFIPFEFLGEENMENITPYNFMD